MRWAQVKAKSSVGGWHNRCVTPGHGHAAGALAAPATRVKPRLSRRRLAGQATADRSDAPPDERQPPPCRARALPPAHLPPPPDSRARSRRAAAPRATAAPRLARSAGPEPAAIRAPAPPAQSEFAWGGIGGGAAPPPCDRSAGSARATPFWGKVSEGGRSPPPSHLGVPRSGRASWNSDA